MSRRHRLARHGEDRCQRADATREAASENGTLDVQPLTAALDRELDALVAHTTDPIWVGYAVATNPRSDDGGCWSSQTVSPPVGASARELEERRHAVRALSHRRSPRSIAFASRHMNARSTRRSTVRWLTGVSADREHRLAHTRFTAGESARRLQNQAVVAIALHADPLALDRLLSLARTARRAPARRRAVLGRAARRSEGDGDRRERDRQRPGHRGQEERPSSRSARCRRTRACRKMIEVARSTGIPRSVVRRHVLARHGPVRNRVKVPRVVCVFSSGTFPLLVKVSFAPTLHGASGQRRHGGPPPIANRRPAKVWFAYNPPVFFREAVMRTAVACLASSYSSPCRSARPPRLASLKGRSLVRAAAAHRADDSAPHRRRRSRRRRRGRRAQGRVAYINAQGVMDLETKQPMTPSTCSASPR